MTLISQIEAELQMTMHTVGCSLPTDLFRERQSWRQNISGFFFWTGAALIITIVAAIVPQSKLS